MRTAIVVLVSTVIVCFGSWVYYQLHRSTDISRLILFDTIHCPRNTELNTITSHQGINSVLTANYYYCNNNLPIIYLDNIFNKIISGECVLPMLSVGAKEVTTLDYGERQYIIGYNITTDGTANIIQVQYDTYAVNIWNINHVLNVNEKRRMLNIPFTRIKGLLLSARAKLTETNAGKTLSFHGAKQFGKYTGRCMGPVVVAAALTFVAAPEVLLAGTALCVAIGAATTITEATGQDIVSLVPFVAQIRSISVFSSNNDKQIAIHCDRKLHFNATQCNATKNQFKTYGLITAFNISETFTLESTELSKIIHGNAQELFTKMETILVEVMKNTGNKAGYSAQDWEDLSNNITQVSEQATVNFEKLTAYPGDDAETKLGDSITQLGESELAKQLANECVKGCNIITQFTDKLEKKSIVQKIRNAIKHAHDNAIDIPALREFIKHTRQRLGKLETTLPTTNKNDIE